MLNSPHNTILVAWPKNPCSTEIGLVDFESDDGLILQDHPALFSFIEGQTFMGDDIQNAIMEGVKFGPYMIPREVLVETFGRDAVCKAEDNFTEASNDK